MKSIHSVAITLLLIVIAWEGAPAVGHPLRSVEVFNTGPFECGRAIESIEWVNDTGDEIYIRRAELWMGMYVGAIADLTFVVQRGSDPTNLFRGNWDHYAEPTGIHGQILTAVFAPDYIEIAPGDLLRLWYRCESFAGPTAGHIIVTIWLANDD